MSIVSKNLIYLGLQKIREMHQMVKISQIKLIVAQLCKLLYTVPKSFVGIDVPTKVVGMLVVSAFLQRFWECRLFSRVTKYKNRRSLTFSLFIDQLTS